MRRPYLALIAALVVLAAACGDDGGADVRQSAPVTITGEALPAYEQGGESDPAVGLPAPEVAGVSFDGTEVSIADDGRPKVLFFLAHW